MTSFHKPKVSSRYVDDVFDHFKRETNQPLLDYLNTQHRNIRLTFEEEENGQLPYLDSKVKRNSKVWLTYRHIVYRKLTHTHQYLTFDLHHPTSAKNSVVHTPKHRADQISSMKEDKEAEHNEILHQHYQTATHNASPRNDPEAEKKPPPVGTAVIPFVGWTS